MSTPHHPPSLAAGLPPATWPAMPSGPGLPPAPAASFWRRLGHGLRTAAVILFWLALMFLACTVDAGW